MSAILVHIIFLAFNVPFRGALIALQALVCRFGWKTNRIWAQLTAIAFQFTEKPDILTAERFIDTGKARITFFSGFIRSAYFLRIGLTGTAFLRT